MTAAIQTIAALVAALVSSVVVGQPQTPANQLRKAVPRFEDYRVPTPIPGRPGGPVYVANHVPDLEAVLRETAKVGPNFAGRFVVEQYACGSACTSFAVVDVKTGAVHYPKFDVSGYCPQYETASSPVLHRLDSRLLLVTGKIETYPAGRMTNSACGQFFYEWTGKGLKLIHSVVSAALHRRRRLACISEPCFPTTRPRTLCRCGWMYGERQDYEHGWIKYAPDHGFVAGCIWGDDSSWKIQYLDLSRVEEGIIQREDRFGYIELPRSVVLRNAIHIYGPPDATSVHIAISTEWDLKTRKMNAVGVPMWD